MNTGQAEIEEVQEQLEFKMRGRGSAFGELIVLPIYASLPTDMQVVFFCFA